MSANVGDALLGLCLGSGLGLHGEREDSCVLPFIEPRQQHDLAIGELERVMIGVKHAFVDLTKDRNGVAGIDTKDEGRLILDRRLEREFGTRKYADSHRTILRRGESSCAGAEVVCDEFFAHFGWACSHAVQTVVAHIKELLSWKPPDSTTLTENTPQRINREQVPLASRRTPRTNSVTTAENDICLAERRLREASMANAAQQMPEHVGTAYKNAVDNIIFLKRQQWLA